MATKITTQSGSTYVTLNGYWKKNDGLVNKAWRFSCISDEDLANAANWPDLYDAEPHPIKVGLRILATAKDEAWLSTPITSIEEVDDGSL